MAIRERNIAGGTYTDKYQHTDALGSPVAVTDQNRAVVETSEYEPYGKLANRAEKDGPGYTGRVQDAASGMTYMQQRYYDPQLGLFLSIDPVTSYSSPDGAFNRYWYANDNPYKFIDPAGQVVQYAFINGATVGDGAVVLNYWMNSPTIMGELNQIIKSNTAYTIEFSRGGGKFSYDSSNNTVHIDVTSGLKIKSSGQVQSPALGGGHEVSHAAQNDRVGDSALNKSLEPP